jgi:hypothetical protein
MPNHDWPRREVQRHQGVGQRPIAASQKVDAARRPSLRITSAIASRRMVEEPCDSRVWRTSTRESFPA